MSSSMLLAEKGESQPICSCSEDEWETAPSLLGSPEIYVQWYTPPRRKYSKRELLADRSVNFLGAGLSWPLAVAICARSMHSQQPAIETAGFVVFGAGLIWMLNGSALYHLWAWEWRRAQIYVTLDQCGITAMIMGAYTPMMIAIDCYKCLALVWALGLVGFGMEAWKLHARRDEVASSASTWTAFDSLNLTRWLLMGWVPVIFAYSYVPSVCDTAQIVLLASGAVLYTVGVPIWLRDGMEFHLTCWHIFVLAATMCIYALFWSMATR